jgi:signal transduction histidine kinase/DNA-binding response OmpR family regulator
MSDATMRYIRNLPIRRKLMLITTVISGLALIVACAAFTAYDYITFQQFMVKEWIASADLVGANSTAALSFGDHDAARETLSSFRDTSGIRSARIYDLNGQLFASFISPGVTAAGTTPSVPDSFVFDRDSLTVSRTINLDGKPIGIICVSCDLQQLHERMRAYGVTLLLVLLGGLSASLIAVTRLEGMIIGPILSLTQTARKITENKEYSARAVKSSDDELGTLIECFNGMLSQIQQRDEQLILHRDHLEELVTERTAQLVAARDRAEESNRAKSNFLANMSHEIRTPMTAILGYADLMLSPVQTMSDRINSLQVVRRNARHLMDLINDILDISKIEAEKMTVEKIPCDIAQAAVEVASMLRPRALVKQLPLSVEFACAIPSAVLSDPLRLKQVLMNLVGNAIKFTNQGEIRLKVSIEKHENRHRALFAISDTGIGMTSDQQRRLFKAFAQADESMTRKYGGTGLGLVISKRLANIMGGDIAVQSEPGRGTTFLVSIDAEIPEGSVMRTGLTESMLALPETGESADNIVLRGQILLAEDGLDNQQLLTMHLTMAGADVTLAENGRIAIDRATTGAFDLILMDMQMPELDGYSATSELRRLGFTLPIVALTAHAMSDDRAKCIAAGCTDYLTKPIDKELLLRTVASYLNKSDAVRSSIAVSAPPIVVPTREAAAVTAPLTASISRSETVAAAMKKAVSGFVSRLPDRVDTLVSQIHGVDLEQLRRTVHQLKGAGAGYGFPGISETAARAEAAIKAATDVTAIQKDVEELIALIRSTQGYDRSLEKGGCNASAEIAHH